MTDDLPLLGAVALDFGPAPGGRPPADLSAAARSGATLFVASDEGRMLHCLARVAPDLWRWRADADLSALFDLAREEHDVEGLAVDGGWLWVVGSHARRRPKPESWARGADPFARADAFDGGADRGRRLLGRAPLVADAAGGLAPVRVAADGRTAARLPLGKGGLRELAGKSPLLGPFMGLATKENGFDVEAIAVRGERVWLGLRGPVVRGLAVVLALEVRSARADRLKAHGRPTLRLLDLDGCGVRDMALDGDDLLLLAGPTMAALGPAFLARWRGGATARGAGFVDPARVERLGVAPKRGPREKPEALVAWPEAGPGAFLALCDSPAAARFGAGGTLVGDVVRA